MVNYLFSSIDKDNGFNKEQENILKQDILSNQNITFISSIFDNYERNDKQLIKYLYIFNKIGINFKEHNLIDLRINPSEAKRILQKTDIIFLLGGSPELQMKYIKEYEIEENIKKCNIVMGVSAGSMNQSKRVIYKDDFDNYIKKDYEGLNIVDINIFPHYTKEDKLLVEEANEISEEIPLILLPNESFIKIDNGNINIYGLAYNQYKGKIKKYKKI